MAVVDDRDSTTTGKVDASPGVSPLRLRQSGSLGEVVHRISPAARSRLAIFLGVVLGLALLAAAWAFSGGPGPG